MALDLREFRALAHAPMEVDGVLADHCIPDCLGCRQETAVAALVAECDRYREALERVYQVGRGPHVEIAREALNA